MKTLIDQHTGKSVSINYTASSVMAVMSRIFEGGTVRRIPDDNFSLEKWKP